MTDTGDDAMACEDAALALQAVCLFKRFFFLNRLPRSTRCMLHTEVLSVVQLLARHGMDDAMKPSQAEPFILVANVHRLSVDIIAERLRVSRENVLIWYVSVQVP